MEQLKTAFCCDLDAIAALVPWMQQRAPALDRDAAFPAAELAALRDAGALTPLLGDASALSRLLVATGQGNLSVGRLLEAHVNALHLMSRHGARPEPGILYGLWVTDPSPSQTPLQMHRTGGTIRLTGGKQFCSGVGHVGGALVTARDKNDAMRMLVLRLGMGERVTPLPAPLQGMRAAVTGAVDFTGCCVSAEALLGEPGDYLREPDFSIGAWRGSAVAFGGLVALIDCAVEWLGNAGRSTDPHVAARLGKAFIDRETARLWVAAAARCGEDTNTAPGRRIATIGLARLAVEAAALEAMLLLQRSIGLSSFRQGTLFELVCRDLATYLRQPAPDAVLTEAAAWFAANPWASVTP